MVLLIEKLGLLPKHPFKMEHPNALNDFQSKVADLIGQIFSKPDPGSAGLLSLTGFRKCFQLVHLADKAFAKLVAEIDCPMSRWGGEATEEYMNYSVNLLGILNSITSSLSHLSQVRVSILQSLTSQSKNSPKKITPGNKKLEKELKLEGPVKVGLDSHSSDKEAVVLQAKRICKKIEFLVLGFVLSGLCGDAKPYLEIRKFFGGFKDSATDSLDLRLSTEVVRIQQGMVMEDLREVNGGLSEGTCIEEMKARLKVLENSIQGVEKEASSMFYEVLGRRNKLLDNVRLTGQSGGS